MLRLPSRALGALALAGLTSLAAAAPAQVPTRPDTTRRPDSAAAARGDTVRRDSTRHDTTLTAAPDQARGIDAEVRAALYELLADRTLPALSRLDWIASSPVALTGVSDAPALMSRQDLLFLLSQAQYRLGMSDAFRATAQQLTGVSAPPAAPATPTTPSQTVAGSTRTRAGRDSSADSSAAAVAPATTASAGTVTAAPGRYAGLLQLQLTMDAYRRGDFAQAASLAGAVGSGSDRGLAGLIAGLANYGAGNWAGASSSFDAAVQAGGSFAPYAEYMRALALMHGDTTQAGAALDALQALGGRALAEFADQVWLTAAQLAYQLKRYDVAAADAARVNASGGLAAQATLTRAWALYKSNQLDAAASAFRDFATRYANLPERDEARLMAGQAILQQGRTDEAARYFQAVADSIGGEVSALQARAATASTDAARALVTARTATLLFLNDPASGKTLALPEAVGSDRTSLATLFGAAAPSEDPLRPDIISLAELQPRLDSVGGGSIGGGARRLMYLASTGANRATYFQRARALREADVAVALADYRLRESINAQQAKVALIQRLQQLLGETGQRMAPYAAQVSAARDSLVRLSQQVQQTRTRLQDFMKGEAESVRLLAVENQGKIDSLRTTTGLTLGSDSAVASLESSTAASYRALAEMIAQGLESAFAHHPVFRLQDSIRAHADSIQGMLAETQNELSNLNQLLAGEAARLQGGESERTVAARAVLAAAEARRSAVEGQVVAVVDAELRARSTQMLALLRRDTEAAEFGSASASFFKAVEGSQRPAGASPTTTTPTSAGAPSAGTAGASGGTVRSPRGGTPGTRPSRRTTTPR